ncbi:uncharacterized protein [Panulirus ornatus]|uniref:uncharacterized protein n=1 Tax=Panulirus ornatus TaxID=150431 RepID=UPI003A88C6EF
MVEPVVRLVCLRVVVMRWRNHGVATGGDEAVGNHCIVHGGGGMGVGTIALLLVMVIRLLKRSCNCWYWYYRCCCYSCCGCYRCLMAWALRMVLLTASLLTADSSDEENQTRVLQIQGNTTDVTQRDPVHVAFTKVGIAMAVIFGGCLLFREIGAGILDKLATKDEDEDGYEEKEKDEKGGEDSDDDDDEVEEYTKQEMYSSYSHYNLEDTFHNQPRFYDDHSRSSQYRSLVDNECFLARIFYSIDPVESAFAMLQVDDLTCRRRIICELQKVAFRMPLIGSLLLLVSRCIRGLEAYREAQEAGAALEDCALLFAECPTNTLDQTSEPRHIPARPA